jgi:hypothetical protein
MARGSRQHHPAAPAFLQVFGPLRSRCLKRHPFPGHLVGLTSLYRRLLDHNLSLAAPSELC